MPNWIFNPFDIPKEKAKVVARLDIMKLGGWKELESMSADELDALQEEAESAALTVGKGGYIDPDNEHNRTIFEAREAIKGQRLKNRQAEYDRRSEQVKRHNAIRQAGEHIRVAVDLMEQAHRIEPDHAYYESQLPIALYDADPSALSVGELKHFVRCHDPRTIGRLMPDESLLSMLNTSEAKAIAAEAAKLNREFQERFEALSAYWTAAKAELVQRKKDEEESAIVKKELNESLDDVVAELRSRIEELEANK